MTTPGEQGIQAAKRDAIVRKKLLAIHDEAVELATMVEFSESKDPVANPLHKYAVEVINLTESILQHLTGGVRKSVFEGDIFE